MIYLAIKIFLKTSYSARGGGEKELGTEGLSH
jgi:hypothetical protein